MSSTQTMDLSVFNPFTGVTSRPRPGDRVVFATDTEGYRCIMMYRPRGHGRFDPLVASWYANQCRKRLAQGDPEHRVADNLAVVGLGTDRVSVRCVHAGRLGAPSEYELLG